jgi:hypothetical protein
MQARRTTRDRREVKVSASDSGLAVENRPEIGLEICVGSIGKTRLRQNDDVQPRARFVVTVELACQALGPVPPNRPSNSPGGDNAQPTHVEAVRQDDDGHVAATCANATLLDLEKLRTPPEAFRLCQASRHTRSNVF